MRRILGAVVVLLLGVVFFSTQTVTAQNTNNFRISNYDIHYELSRNSEGRSVLKTTETITAVFPNFNQNRGLERAIPTKYDNHLTGLTINEVVNLTDGNTEYSENKDDGVNVLRIGNSKKYVKGEQVYRIVYTQHDVTRFFEDTDRDEWYWDTNGVEWRVPIEKLNISISLSDDVAGKLAVQPLCYKGKAGSTDRCSIEESGDGSYTAIATDLTRRENVTVAFGFEKGTFAAYQTPWWQTALAIWGVVQVVTLVLACIIGIIATVKYYKRKNRSAELKQIPAEYIPPRDASVMISSKIIPAYGSAFAAQLLDLAVRRFISIVETGEKSTWRAAEYDIVITGDVALLREEEKEIINDMFGKVPQVGERLSLKSLNTNSKYFRRTSDNDKKLKALIETTYTLRHKDAAASKPFYKWATVLIIIAVLMLSLPLAIVSGTIAIMGHVLRPLTDNGLALRRYVMGLDKYIKASETERIAFLQGPDTAQKVGYNVDVNNPGQMVKLYERTLPYAVLFGREKEWSERLGNFYATSGSTPDWYRGASAFNAALFASAITRFSQASAYSGGASSSSGGSGGGGVSGGGGGGGGGGGW